MYHKNLCIPRHSYSNLFQKQYENNLSYPLHQQANLAHSLSHPYQPDHGTDDRNDRYRLSGPCRRNRTWRFGHRWRILYGHLHGSVRLQHRHPDTHRPAQRRSKLQNHRFAPLPGHLFPNLPGSRPVPALLLLLAHPAEAHHRIAANLRSSQQLPALACIRCLLLVQRSHVPCLSWEPPRPRH